MSELRFFDEKYDALCDTALEDVLELIDDARLSEDIGYVVGGIADYRGDGFFNTLTKPQLKQRMYKRTVAQFYDFARTVSWYEHFSQARISDDPDRIFFHRTASELLFQTAEKARDLALDAEQTCDA